VSYCIDLSGKVAIVTGSTKGLGRAMVEGLADAGAAVVVSSRKQEPCEQVASEVAASTGARAVGIACHVGDWDAVAALVERTMEAFGRIDVLVNNAGINPMPSSLQDIDLALWRKVFSVNLEGPLRTSQLVAPIMRDQGGGSIVNVASLGAYTGGPGVAAYGASKAALINLTRSMAREWAGWRVRVNAISPGTMRSELTDAAERNIPGFYERAGAAAAMNRVGETQEIVGPVLYLASDASSFVTGEDHLVSGGIFRG
jgi:NAD(P)-dependent dehydrogenase (short-subunit alcohol dehydrogenase family)